MEFWNMEIKFGNWKIGIQEIGNFGNRNFEEGIKKNNK